MQLLAFRVECGHGFACELRRETGHVNQVVQSPKASDYFTPAADLLESGSLVPKDTVSLVRALRRQLPLQPAIHHLANQNPSMV
jgi:hypothetical protein